MSRDETCPHCKAELNIENCDECGCVVIETLDGAEFCDDCGGRFCEAHVGEHEHEEDGDNK